MGMDKNTFALYSIVILLPTSIYLLLVGYTLSIGVGGWSGRPIDVPESVPYIGFGFSLLILCFGLLSLIDPNEMAIKKGEQG
jgi:hypothetical protein